MKAWKKDGRKDIWVGGWMDEEITGQQRDRREKRKTDLPTFHPILPPAV